METPIIKLYLRVHLFGEPDGIIRPHRHKAYQELGPSLYYRSYRSRSFVQGFNLCWAATLAHLVGDTDAKFIKAINDTGGTSRNIGDGGLGGTEFRITRSGNTRGIVVGTGTGAVTETDQALGTIITDGTAAGNLVHNAMLFDAPSSSGSTATFVFRSTFSNRSGGTVTVTEVGVYGDFNVDASAKQFLFIRDKLGASVGVVDKSTLAIDYVLQASL